MELILWFLPLATASGTALIITALFTLSDRVITPPMTVPASAPLSWPLHAAVPDVWALIFPTPKPIWDGPGAVTIPLISAFKRLPT